MTKKLADELRRIEDSYVESITPEKQAKARELIEQLRALKLPGPSEEVALDELRVLVVSWATRRFTFMQIHGLLGFNGGDDNLDAEIIACMAKVGK